MAVAPGMSLDEEPAMSAIRHSKAEPGSAGSPLEILKLILSDPTELSFVQQFTTDDFVYVSLNYEHSELKRIMPWAGTNQGARGLVQTFIDVGRYWTTENFEIQDSFENKDGAAIFGSFTYTSISLGRTVTSPFAVLARGQDGKLSYVQFMEDTFATARSFRESGEYLIKASPDGSEIRV